MNTNLTFIRKITNFEYDEENSVLTVYFTVGIKKRYFNVPKLIYDNLQKSPDKDQFYHSVIDGEYCVE
jgi:hypothetical protein